MKKKAIFFSLLLFCLSAIYATDFQIERGDYNINDFSKRVEESISTALDSTLVGYTKVDDSLLSSLKIYIVKVEYEDSLFNLTSKVTLNANTVPISIQFIEKDEDKLFKKLDQLLFDTFKYDLSTLFNSESEYVLSYNENFKSFENKNNKFRVGDFLYLSDFENDKSLATVNSVFNEVATLHFLYNPSSLVNLKIERGPIHQLGVNIAYDFDENIMSVSGEYFYLKSLFGPFNTTYLGLSSSLFYDLENTEIEDVSIDSNLLIEFPLSIIFKSTYLLNSATIYSKVKLGALVYEDTTLHSAFEIGYKQYLSTNLKVGLSYKMDSKNEMYNSILFGTEILF